jgi:hypothetical protein
MDRDNRHALVHALTLRYGSYDLASRPCGVAFQVYRALAERGYLEVFLRCRRCRPLRKWICSSPEDGPYVRGESCRVLAAQSAPIFACPIGARRVEACVSFFRVRLSR